MNRLGRSQTTGASDNRPVVPGKNREYDLVRDGWPAMPGRDEQIRESRTACRETILGLAGHWSAESGRRSLAGLPSYR